jgi:hypothetical protein
MMKDLIQLPTNLESLRLIMKLIKKVILLIFSGWIASSNKKTQENAKEKSAKIKLIMI